MAVTFDLTWDSPEAEEVFKSAKKIKLSEKYFYIADKSIRSKGSGSPNVFTLKQIDDIANMMKNGVSQTKLVEDFQLNYTVLKEITKAYNIKRKVRQGHLYAMNDFGWKCLHAAEHLYDIGKINVNTDEQIIRQLVAYEIAENEEDAIKKLARINYMTVGHNDRYTLIVKEYAETKDNELSENDKRVLDVLNGNLDAIAATDEENSESITEEVKETEAISEKQSDSTEDIINILNDMLRKNNKQLEIKKLMKISNAYNTDELNEATSNLSEAIEKAAEAGLASRIYDLLDKTAELVSLVHEESDAITNATSF